MINVLVAALLGVGASYVSEVGDKLITSGWGVVTNYFKERRQANDERRVNELKQFLDAAKQDTTPPVPVEKSK